MKTKRKILRSVALIVLLLILQVVGLVSGSPVHGRQNACPLSAYRTSRDASFSACPVIRPAQDGLGTALFAVPSLLPKSALSVVTQPEQKKEEQRISREDSEPESADGHVGFLQEERPLSQAEASLPTEGSASGNDALLQSFAIPRLWSSLLWLALTFLSLLALATVGLNYRRLGKTLALRCLNLSAYAPLVCGLLVGRRIAGGLLPRGLQPAMLLQNGLLLLLPLPLLWLRSCRAEARRSGRLYGLWMGAEWLTLAAAVLFSGDFLIQPLQVSACLYLLVISVNGLAVMLKKISHGKHFLCWGGFVVAYLALALSSAATLILAGIRLLRAAEYSLLAGLTISALLLLLSILVLFWSRRLSDDNYDELNQRDHEYRLMSQHSGYYILRYDIPGHKLCLCPETAERLGLPHTIRNIPAVLYGDDRISEQSKEKLKGFFDGIARGEPKGSVVFGYQHPTEGLLWLHGDYVLVEDGRQPAARALISLYKINGLEDKEQTCRLWREKHDRLAADGAVYYELDLTAGKVLACKGTPWPAMPQDMPSMWAELTTLLTHSLTDNENDRAALSALLERQGLLTAYARDMRSAKLEFQRKTEGEPRWTAVELQMIADPYSNGVLAFCLLRDIQQEREQEKQHNKRDELTGLLSRSAFAEQLNDLCRISPPQSCHAVAMLDLDGFKAVNDTFGHGFGDKVLIDIADDLRAILRGDDLLARLGGDEYILCLKNVPQDPEFIQQRSQVIRHALSKQFSDEVAISASIGIALFPLYGRDFETLYKHADEAMYAAKEAGRNRCVIYGNTALPPKKEDTSSAGQYREDHRHTLLIVDDQRMNRALMREMFHTQYKVLEAANGKEAMAVLKDEKNAVSAVLLDLLMPEMDGLDVLQAMRTDALLQTIPVVVVSAADEAEYSTRAIELGAMDYVNKPVDEALVKLRIRNAIVRRESENLRAQNRELLVQRANEARHQKQLQYLADHDTVTHLFNKTAFYRRTRALLEGNPGREYCIICFDILRFRAVNDIFGHDEGDRLLRFVAMQVQNLVGEDGTCARISMDLFVLCIPYAEQDVQRVMEHLNQTMKGYDLSFEIQLCYGVYRIEDPKAPIHRMQDRAMMAERSAKAGYIRKWAYYDDSMRQRLLEEQEILNSMNAALENHEFIVYYQPKCLLDTGKVIGAEALVRWQHPTRGLLNPSSFIPIFERNGFVMKLDIYIWEQVCIFLQERLKENPDDGLRISANISRANLYNVNLCETLNGLCRKYGIPNDRMDVEITESAYVENTQLLKGVTDQLHGLGFLVEMDDFGSGYSSLNMLKEIPVDVLKLDMRFLYGMDQTDRRGGSILSSVVSMAHRLNIRVVAEGVETEEQARLLATMGCHLAQGYYYAHPMPGEDFIRRLKQQDTEKPLLNDLQSAKTYLSHLLCSAMIVHRRQKQLKVLCVNEYYLRMMSITQSRIDSSDRDLNSWIGTLDAEQLTAVMDTVSQTREAGQCTYLQRDLQNHYHLLKARIMYISPWEDGALYLLSLSNEPERKHVFQKDVPIPTEQRRYTCGTDGCGTSD